MNNWPNPSGPTLRPAVQAHGELNSTSFLALCLYMMERGSRKRARVTTLEVVREKEKEEGVTLKLKSSKTAKKDSKDPILLLEEASTAEEEESVLETLLLLEDSTYSGIVSSLDEALTLFNRIWKTHQSNIEICSVLVNLLCGVLPSVTSLSRDQQNQIASLIDHREFVVN